MIFTPGQFAGGRSAKAIHLDPALSQAFANGGYGVASEIELLELYALSQTVYTCANIRAENVAAVPMRVVDANGKPLAAHPVAPIFSAMSNYKDTAMRTELSMVFTGANVTLPQPNFAGLFTRWSNNLRWLNPRIWTRRIDIQRGLIGFNIMRTPEYGDLDNFIPIEQTIYFQGVDLLDDFDAVSPAEVAYNAAMAQNEMWQTLKSTMENRAVPATILQAAQGTENAFRSNPDVPKTLAGILDKLFRGSKNAGKTLVSPDRLEAVQLQQELDKMALETIAPEQRQAVAEAMQVPDVLIHFSGATFDNAEGAVQFWYRNWLKPRCEWYAQGYSRFFTKWMGEPVYIVPDFTDIIQEDDDTDRINTQVSAGYRDLYSAQQETGIAPDDRLKGVYMWNGTPTRIETLVVEPVLPVVPRPAIVRPNFNSARATDDGEAYVTIPLPNDPALIDLQNQIKALGIAGVEYQDPKTFHVTLVYCKDISHHDLVSEIADRSQLGEPIEIAGNSIGIFENGEERALHVVVDKSPRLLALQASLYNDFVTAGYSSELSEYSQPEKYTPHITLAYLPAGADVSLSVAYRGTAKRIDFNREDYNMVASVAVRSTALMPLASYIPTYVYKEIEIASRKGAAFTAKALPQHTATYILNLVNAGTERTDTIKAATAFYSSAVGAKALQVTRADFMADFSNLLTRALADEANSRMFSSGLRAMLSRYIDRMFSDGLADGGVDDTEIDDEDRRTLARLKAEQSTYVTGLLTAIYRDGKVTADEAEVKPELWLNKSLMPAYNAGLESAAANMLMEFGGDDGEESCGDCQTLKGQIHRYKAWKGRNLVPPTDATECKGFRCNHRLIPAPGQKAAGNWIGAKKSHAHEEAEHATA